MLPAWQDLLGGGWWGALPLEPVDARVAGGCHESATRRVGCEMRPGPREWAAGRGMRCPTGFEVVTPHSHSRRRAA